MTRPEVNLASRHIWIDLKNEKQKVNCGRKTWGATTRTFIIIIYHDTRHVIHLNIQFPIVESIISWYYWRLRLAIAITTISGIDQQLNNCTCWLHRHRPKQKCYAITHTGGRTVWVAFRSRITTRLNFKNKSSDN